MALGQLKVLVAILPKHIGHLAVDQTISKEHFPINKIFDFSLGSELLTDPLNVLNLTEVDSVQELHGVYGASGLVLVLPYLLPFSNSSLLDVDTHLLQDHVFLLFCKLGVGVAPTVGQRELEGAIGILEFELISKGVPKSMPDIGVENIAYAHKGDSAFLAFPKNLFVDESEAVQQPTAHDLYIFDWMIKDEDTKAIDYITQTGDFKHQDRIQCLQIWVICALDPVLYFTCSHQNRADGD